MSQSSTLFIGMDVHKADSYPQSRERRSGAEKRSKSFEEKSLLMVCVSCSAK
jgi:hypothetical protein